MRQIHDADVLILLATTLSSKRRPATLIEIVAAADLINEFIPATDHLDDAIRHLSTAGLISATEHGFTLTASAQALMATQPQKGAKEEIFAAVKQALADYQPRAESAAIVLTSDELGAAVRAHKASRKAPGKNLLMPKAKPDRHFKVEGRWRRAPAKR